MPVSVGNDERGNDADQYLPEIVSNIPMKEKIQFADRKCQGQAAKQECDGSLRRTIFCDPSV